MEEADLRRQRVHVVAEHRAAVGVGVEIVVAGVAAELHAGGAQDVVAAGLERVLLGPHLAHDLQPRIAAAGVDAEQTAPGAQRARQRRHHLGRLELDGHAGAIGLRGDDEIVVGSGMALLGDHVVEQEAEIVAVDHQGDGALVDGVAGLGRVPGLPVLGQKRLQRGDLVGELGRRGARQRHLVPHQRGGRGERLRRQPRRLGVVHVGDHQHGRGVLVEAVGHLVQRQPHVLQADLLAHRVERQRRKAAVHLAQNAGEDRAVAHAGVEQAHRRRRGMQMAELHGRRGWRSSPSRCTY